MIQELFSLDLTNEWRPKEVLQTKINELTESGWRVVSIVKIDGEHQLLAEKEEPPPVLFTLPADTTREELDKVKDEIRKQYESGALQEHRPIILSGDVTVTTINRHDAQVVEVTRDMLDSWFGVDSSVTAAKKLVSEIQHEINEGRMSVNDARRLLDMEPLEGVDNLV